MTPPKLSDSDKQVIFDLYRRPEETTASIANRYGVSTTTISRILKAGLPDAEYESLMHQKRALRFQGGQAETMALSDTSRQTELALPIDLEEDQQEDLEQDVEEDLGKDQEIVDLLQQRQRSVAPHGPPILRSKTGEVPSSQPKFTPRATVDSEFVPLSQAFGTSAISKRLDLDSPAPGLAPEFTPKPKGDLGSEDDDEDLTGEDLDDLDSELDDDDLEDGEDFDDEEGDGFLSFPLPGQTSAQVLPLAEATMPQSFYLVVDRWAELVTRPLKDFGDLGQIPSQDGQERTLPIFDNHRVARRFSGKAQRVVKVPDSSLLPKVTPYLQAKGITRLLLDGQLYSL